MNRGEGPFARDFAHALRFCAGVLRTVTRDLRLSVCICPSVILFRSHTGRISTAGYDAASDRSQSVKLAAVAESSFGGLRVTT